MDKNEPPAAADFARVAADLLSPTVVAQRMGNLRPQSLRVRRMRGTSPPYIRLGGRTGRVMYPTRDFEAWLAAQPRYSGTAQEKAALRAKDVTLGALDSAPLAAKPKLSRAKAKP